MEQRLYSTWNATLKNRFMLLLKKKKYLCNISLGKTILLLRVNEVLPVCNDFRLKWEEIIIEGALFNFCFGH